MKNSFTQSFFYIIAGFSILLFLHFSQNDGSPVYDASPYSVDHIDFGSAPFPFPLSWNFYYINTPGLNFATVGASYFKEKYYLNTWNSANVCYTLSGTGLQNEPDINTLDSITSPVYTGAIRDMAVGKDASGKEFLWGGKAGNVLYKMDSTLNVKAEITIPGGQFRAIAWDPNRKGFWNSNFSGDIICHDTMGNIRGSIKSSLNGKYGLAWDSITTPDSAFLWVWDQGGGNSTLHKIQISSGIETGAFETGLYNGLIAGGASIFKFGNTYKMLLNFQSSALVCYNLTNNGSDDCTISYYRNNVAKPIPDNNPVGIYDTLTVDNYRGTPGNITIVLDTVYHSWVGDLTMILYHGGISDTLMHRPGNAFGNPFGSNGDNFIGTQLADDGSTSMDSITAFMQPCTSPPRFRPGTKYGMDSLSNFVSSNINGDWILWIRDNASGDNGSLEAWHLCVEDLSTGISENETSIKDYFLMQNYPNPFNPSTTIDYNIPKPGFVNITIFDITGREVAVLENVFRSPGLHSVVFDGSGLSSGIYFYMLKSGTYTEVKKMILLK